MTTSIKALGMSNLMNSGGVSERDIVMAKILKNVYFQKIHKMTRREIL